MHTGDSYRTEFTLNDKNQEISMAVDGFIDLYLGHSTPGTAITCIQPVYDEWLPH